MVEIYEQFDDIDAFEPIKLTCAVKNYALTKLNQILENLPQL